MVRKDLTEDVGEREICDGAEVEKYILYCRKTLKITTKISKKYIFHQKNVI